MSLLYKYLYVCDSVGVLPLTVHGSKVELGIANKLRMLVIQINDFHATIYIFDMKYLYYLITCI